MEITKGISRKVKKRIIMNKKTAVEWLEELIECGADLDVIKKVIPRAKEMEKQQIIDAWGNGWSNGHIEINQYEDIAEQYYNETFNK
jgi:hypothetical protein